MGWQSDDGQHEGYIAGLVPHSVDGQEYLREMRYGVDEALFESRMNGEREVPLKAFRVACTCGWRSTCYSAPAGAYQAEWATMGLPDAHRDAAQDLWERHIHEPRMPGLVTYREVTGQSDVHLSMGPPALPQQQGQVLRLVLGSK